MGRALALDLLSLCAIQQLEEFVCQIRIEMFAGSIVDVRLDLILRPAFAEGSV